ncbi:MAG: BamA/TamA family outer membrane protein [Alphaproteobacteria bacterium]
MGFGCPRWVWLLLAFLLATESAYAAGEEKFRATHDDAATPSTYEKGQAIGIKPGESFVIFPIPIGNPTVGAGLGLATALLYQVDDQSKPSYTGIGGFYTSNDSWGGGAMQQLSFDGDRYRMSFAIGYASIHYDFFGVGTAAGNTGASIPIVQQGTYIKPVFLVRVFEDTHVGVHYRYVDIGTEIDFPDRGTALGNLLGDRNTDLVSAGPGLVFDWDTTDNSFYPTSGHLVDAEMTFATASLYSDRTYRKGYASGAIYREDFDGGVLAGRLSGCYAGGDVPLFDLCLFGANNDLRGYETGRYRDRALLAGQIEQRWNFSGRWGLVGFAGIGAVAPSFGDMLDTDLLASGGAGLRFEASKEYHVNLAIDWAVNADGDTSLYFRIGEAF